MRQSRKERIGARLRELRESNGLAQWELGQELGLQSPQSGIAKRESGEVDVSRAERRTIAGLFQMTEDEAFPMCAEGHANVG
jgi:transcriptional regulator with XRE-family HTH domain